MKTTNRKIAKSLLLGVAVALTLLALRGVSSAAAAASDLKVEKTCGPAVFRPNEWTAYQCLIRLTNTGDAPLSNITSAYTSSSGVIPTYYFMLHEVDGKPMPIDPTGLSFGSDLTLQPGQSADVRLVVLLKMDREGAYVGEWPAEVDGEVVPGSAALHYEAKASAVDPPTDLQVSQIGYRKDTAAVFEITITNNTSKPVTELSVTEHYGSNAKLVVAGSTSAQIPGANLVKWDLASLGVQSLAPGESLKLQTIYEPEDNAGSVRAGVLVEATVGGEHQLYGSSGGSVCFGCDSDEGGPTSSYDGSQPPSFGSDFVLAPRTGEGPGPASVPATLCAALLVGVGVALGSVALVARRGIRR